jgi:chromosomal replication initiator protein
VVKEGCLAVESVVALSFTDALAGAPFFFAERENVLVQALPECVLEPRLDRMPLVIWGPSGAGKTLLVSGLMESWRQLDPTRKTRVISGVDFARQFADAVDTDTLDAFRQSFQNIGLIALEHVQVLASKPAAAREFGYLLDRWLRQSQLVIVTSLVPPSQLDALALASRLQGGLVVPLAMPSAAVLKAFLQHQMQTRGWNGDELLAETLFQRLSQYLRADFSPHAMMGALNQLELSMQTHSASLTADLITATFPILERAPITISQIWTVVAKQFHVTLAELRSSSRRQSLVQARGVAALLARELVPASLQEIGRELGNRDHSTISHVLEKTEATRQEDASFAAMVESLRTSLLSPAPIKRARRTKPGKNVSSVSPVVAPSYVSNKTPRLLF